MAAVLQRVALKGSACATCLWPGLCVSSPGAPRDSDLPLRTVSNGGRDLEVPIPIFLNQHGQDLVGSVDGTAGVGAGSAAG